MMTTDKKQNILLGMDALVNLLLGIFLVLTPFGTLSLLGLPAVESYFYTTILGGVIFGIGIALLIELTGKHRGISGLGVAGAISINLCGAGILLGWLLFTDLNLPLRGQVSLWALCLLVLGLGLIELFSKTWKTK